MTLAPMKMRNFRDTVKACAKAGDNQFQYLKGHTKGHFPVPAIRQHYEFGFQLGHGPVLMHVVYGVYDEL